MKNRQNQHGFTLAELLIVVAIIGVLAGVAFVAVQSYQEGMNQVELDTVAKEIFVAAQNHLTMARNEGYLGMIRADATDDEKKAFYGESGNVGKGGDTRSDEYYDKTSTDPSVWRGVYYINVQSGTPDASIFGLMLPPYALDGTVLANNYVIRYQPSSGLVLDVFYASASSSNKYHRNLPSYDNLMALRWDENKGERRKQHIGWYGGNEAASLPKGDPLEAPVLEVENGEKLIAKITDQNTLGRSDYKIAFLVTGKVSKAQQVFRLENAATGTRIEGDKASGYTVILDDITTANMHFAEIGTANSNAFIPGEDIVLRAVAYNETALSNIANSDEKIVNSLFEKAENADEKAPTFKPIKAYVNNIRHLENLCYAISNVDYSPGSTNPEAAGGTAISTMIVEAEQTTDLEWGKAGSIFKSGTQISTMTKTNVNGVDTTVRGEAGCLLPVNVPASYTVKAQSGNVEVNAAVSYNGTNHSIKGIKVNVVGSAGLFGDLSNGSSVQNLAFIDFNITSSSGSAGALAGTLTQSTALTSGANVSNVVAYNTSKATAATINTAGDVGGLIGKVTGEHAAIEKSAAALVVKSTGEGKAAGGLIGSMTGGSVTGCYSGGHTIDKKDGANVIGVIYDSANYNVTATAGTAGGLIGVATNMGNVANCYSTCSATGKVAGGFAGTYAGTSEAEASLGNCYATGLVCGTDSETATVGTGDDAVTYTLPKDGAFAYSLTGLTAANITGCSYYEIINERIERETSGASGKTYAISANKPSGSMTSADSVAYLTAFGKFNANGKDADNKLYNVTALDASAGDYNTFVGAPDTWNKAAPYDGTLLKYYSVKTTYPDGVDNLGKPKTKDVMEARYNLKGIKGLDATVTDEDFVATHYGDWPAPEIFVFNTK